MTKFSDLDFPTAAPSSPGEISETDRGMTFGMLGILLFLDVCFISNYFIIVGLRRCTDAHFATLPPESDFGHTAYDEEESGPPSRTEKFIYFLLFGGLIKPIPRSVQRKLETCFYAIFLGRVKPMPLSIQRFPGWAPIRFKAQILLSAIFILISLICLNPETLVPKDVNVGGITIGGEFCKPFDRQKGLDELKDEVLNLTNFNQGVKQWLHMYDFHTALLNDTSRYGVRDGNFDDTCPLVKGTAGVSPDVSGNKQDWSDFTKFPAVEFGPFFPGYCSGARETAQLNALSAQCTDEKCACPRIPDWDVCKFFGIAGLELCFMRVCLTSPISCPRHSNDDPINPDNYRETQLNTTDPGTPKVDATRAKLSDAGKQAARTGIKLLLYQVDVASNLYALYTVVALFFPFPIVIFRLPRWIAVKRLLFGADQTMFIIVFVSSIWIFTYLRDHLISPDFRIALANLINGDPCYLDGKYMFNRYQVVDDLCDKLLPLQPDFARRMQTIPAILNEIDEFAKASCRSCKFPMRSMFALNTENFPLSEVGPLGFTIPSPPGMCDKGLKPGCTVLLPANTTEFLGNRTICLDSEFAKSRVMKPPDTEFQMTAFVNLWVSSGLLASFLVKIAMTNFATGLLHLADPFLSCNGEFLWIPSKLGSGLGGRDKNKVFRNFKENKRLTFRNIYLKSVIIWGTIMHTCVFNLLKTAFTSTEQLYGGLLLSDIDRAILTFTMSSSLVIILMTCCWTAVLRRKIRAHRRKAKELGYLDESNSDTYRDEEEFVDEADE